MHPNVREGHETLWKKYFNAETGLFYDYEIVDPVQFPTRDEVAQNIPAANGGFTPLNDPNLQGGWILTANLRGFALTGQSEYAEKARKIFRGLVRLGGLARTKGFVPRGAAPGHDVVYINSSVDQYTSFVYAMWRFRNSPVSTDAEKKTAAEKVLATARLIESFSHDVPSDLGQPTFYGEMSSIEDGFRGCRLLFVYRTAFLMSGDEHWERLYREKLEEADRKRLKTYPTLQTFPPERPIANWSLWQNQTAFRMLFETETDPDLRAIFRAALDEQAKVALPRLGKWREQANAAESLVIPDRWRLFWPEFVKAYPNHDQYGWERPYHHHSFARFVRENESRIPIPKEMLDRATVAQGVPGQALQFLACAMYAEDPAILREAAKDGLPMLTTANLTRPAHCAAMKCFEIAYWRGVAEGFFPRD